MIFIENFGKIGQAQCARAFCFDRIFFNRLLSVNFLPDIKYCSQYLDNLGTL